MTIKESDDLLADLEQFPSMTMPIDEEVLDTMSPEDLIQIAVIAQGTIAATKLLLDNIKQRLNGLRDLGLVEDKVLSPVGTASFQVRETWQYTPAVKELQDMEILEGLATKKTSASWTIRAIKPKSK